MSNPYISETPEQYAERMQKKMKMAELPVFDGIWPNDRAIISYIEYANYAAELVQYEPQRIAFEGNAAMDDFPIWQVILLGMHRDEWLPFWRQRTYGDRA